MTGHAKLPNRRRNAFIGQGEKRTGVGPFWRRRTNVLAAMFLLTATCQAADDPRNIRTGLAIPSENYADQPYTVVTPEGHWVVVLTTGAGAEGSVGQHVVSTISTDQGKTWAPLADIEPATGPEASWAVPLLTPSGRIYAFYTYNDVGVTGMRADTLGSYMYKYSDDYGRTWSAQRYELPLRVTEVDRNNDWGGAIQMFWGVDKPKVLNGQVYFAFTKLGKYMLDKGEGWMFHSSNILTEPNPNNLQWEMLPDGEYGIRSSLFGSIQEEHSHVPLGDGSLYTIYRTTNGFPAQSYSRDGGHTWSDPVAATYTPGGRRIKNPRANTKVWKTENGRYLLWYHNNGLTSYNGRDVAWLCGGTEVDGQIHWSQPEIVLYDPDPSVRFSYPDLIEQNGQYWITETNKSTARVHQIGSGLLDALWTQGQVKQVTQNGLALSWSEKDGPVETLPMPTLPNLSQNGGFSLDFWARFDDLTAGQVIADARNGAGKGFVVSTGSDHNIAIAVSDGSRSFTWTSDPGTLMSDRTHHVAAIVDGGADALTFVIDGRVNDGGSSRAYGWTRFTSAMADVNGAASMQLAPSIHGELSEFRLYNRYLFNSEMIANYKAGNPPLYVPPAAEVSLPYDGSYDPYSPPSGQIQWERQGALLSPTIVTIPTGSAAKILDNGTAANQRIQISHAVGDIAGDEWAYEFCLNLVSGADSTVGIFGLGVRDEGGGGRSVWINFFADGLFLLDNGAAKNAGAIQITPDHYRGTGYHMYRVVKFWDTDEFKVQVFIDNEAQFDTPLSYSQMPEDATTDRGFGLFTASYSTSTSYLDYMRFGPISDFASVAGDANLDGVVDELDAQRLATYWGATGARWSQGDFNGDGMVDACDASILAANWHFGVSEATAMPEPNPTLAALMTVLALLGYRR